MTDPKVSRLRLWVLILTIVMVFGAFAGAIIVPVLINNASDETQLEVGCQIIESQNTMLLALEQIRHELGLPGDLVIPEVPPECVGL